MIAHLTDKMEGQEAKSTKCAISECDLNVQQHVHVNVLVDENQDAEELKSDFIFDLLKWLDKKFSEKQEQKQKD
jgi:hypothetical protein